MGKTHWRHRLPELSERTKLEFKNKWAAMSEKDKIAYHLRARYKLPYEKWIGMFEQQDYKCHLCQAPIEAKSGNSKSRGVVDHCHSTKVIRGLLCHHCNRALGLVKENIQTLKNMIHYLEKHNG